MADYRHELKYQINASDVMAIRRRLQILAKPDPHARDGRYLVRSLYFDNLEDKALREKVDGVNRREKFRIRCYNGDFSFIHLEKKCKWGALTRKESIPVSEETVQAILQGRKPDGGISPGYHDDFLCGGSCHFRGVFSRYDQYITDQYICGGWHRRSGGGIPVSGTRK